MECCASGAKLLGLLGLTIVMVGSSYACTTVPGLFPRVVGWIGVGFFGLGFIAIPVMFFRRGPQLVINEEGIEDRRLKVGVIRWSDILSLSIGAVYSAKFLCVEVTDPDEYLSRLPRWKRSLTAATEALGFPALTIGFSGLSPGLKEVWAYLEEQGRCHFESKVIVRVDDKGISATFPTGKSEQIAWSEVKRVAIETNDSGPWGADFWWLLEGEARRCAYPQGATGELEAMDVFPTRFPGFSHEAVIKANCSISNARFVCWERSNAL